MDELDEHELATLQAVARAGGIHPVDVTDRQVMADLSYHGYIAYRFTPDLWMLTDAGWVAIGETPEEG